METSIHSYQRRFIEAFANQFSSKLVMFQLTRCRHLGIGMNQGLDVVGETCEHSTVSAIKDGNAE